jgi:hypothetical protein
VVDEADALGDTGGASSGVSVTVRVALGREECGEVGGVTGADAGEGGSGGGEGAAGRDGLAAGGAGAGAAAPSSGKLAEGACWALDATATRSTAPAPSTLTTRRLMLDT